MFCLIFQNKNEEFYDYKFLKTHYKKKFNVFFNFISFFFFAFLKIINNTTLLQQLIPFYLGVKHLFLETKQL